MARYIDADKLIAEIEENINTYWNEGGGGYYLAEDALEHSIKTAPTALDSQENIATAKSEVAREIFEEIYHILLTSFPTSSFIDAPCTTENRIYDMIAKLKKKYGVVE